MSNEENKTAKSITGLCEAFEIQPVLEESNHTVFVNVEKTVERLYSQYYYLVKNGHLIWVQTIEDDPEMDLQEEEDTAMDDVRRDSYKDTL